MGVSVDRRTDRYGMREVLWSFSAIERVKKCGRVRIRSGHVPVYQRDDRAHVANVASCASVWACPCCSAKIRQERAEEVATMLQAHLVDGRAWLVTLTLPHRRQQPLTVTLGGVLDGWRAVLQDRMWREVSKSLGFAGYVRAVEVTYGQNGWHPHIHAVVLSTGGDLEPALVELQRAWTDAVVRMGLSRPSQDRGARWEELSGSDGGAGVARYVAKVQDPIGVGQELTRGDLKKGRARSCTPYDLLRAVRDDGEADAVALWREYERATKGRRCLTWSRGLRALGQRSDDEIAADEVGGELVGLVDVDTWSELCRTRGGLASFLLDVEAVGFEAAWSVRWDHAPPVLLDGLRV